MRTIYRWVFLLLLTVAPWAVQAQSCAVSGSATATVTDIFGGNVDVQGSVSITCTRPPGIPRFPSQFWIGVSGANGARTLSNGSYTLNYELHTDYAGCSTAWQGTTGLLIPNALTANGDRNVGPLIATFCMRIPSGQITARALTFSAWPTLTVRSTDSAGYVWGTGSLALSATVNPRCDFTSMPTTLSMSYTSFQGAAATGSSDLDLRCTNATSYTLSLDSTTGTAVGLTYDIGIGTVGTGTLGGQSGTGSAISYNLPGRITAGQAGTCAAGGSCTGSDTRTLTVTY